jgi:hypothetical protein
VAAASGGGRHWRRKSRAPAPRVAAGASSLPRPALKRALRPSESWSSPVAPGAAAASSWQWRSAGRRRASSGRLLLPARRPACRCIRFQKQARLATIRQHGSASGGVRDLEGVHPLLYQAGPSTQLDRDDPQRRRERGRRLEEDAAQLATARAARLPHRRSREITNGSCRPPCQRWLSAHGRTRRPLRCEPKGAGVLKKKGDTTTNKKDLTVIEPFPSLFDVQ